MPHLNQVLHVAAAALMPWCSVFFCFVKSVSASSFIFFFFRGVVMVVMNVRCVRLLAIYPSHNGRASHQRLQRPRPRLTI